MRATPPHTAPRYMLFPAVPYLRRMPRRGVYFAKEKSATKVAIQIPGLGQHRYEWRLKSDTRSGQGVWTNDWHVNLYATRADGTEVLMRRDHIMPLSKGGLNVLENQQTMCVRRNGNKKDKLPRKLLQQV